MNPIYRSLLTSYLDMAGMSLDGLKEVQAAARAGIRAAIDAIDVWDTEWSVECGVTPPVEPSRG